jgi:hypothetical protein
VSRTAIQPRKRLSNLYDADRGGGPSLGGTDTTLKTRSGWGVLRVDLDLREIYAETTWQSKTISNSSMQLLPKTICQIRKLKQPNLPFLLRDQSTAHDNRPVEKDGLGAICFVH